MAKFETVAKMAIPNYKERFDFDKETGTIEPRRSATWYSADKDIEFVCSHLNEGDRIQVIINGESKPLNAEGQKLLKELGEEKLLDTNVNEIIGDANAKEYDAYFETFAPTIKGNKELTELAHSLVAQSLDRQAEQIKKDGDMGVYETIQKTKSKVGNIDSFTTQIDGYAETAKPIEPIARGKGLPKWAQALSERHIQQVGGYEQLGKLIEAKGEQEAISLLNLLGIPVKASKTQDPLGV